MSHTEERLRDQAAIKEGIEQTYKEIFELDNNINDATFTLRGKIRYLADQYEELHNQSGYPLDLRDISTEIIRQFEKRGRPHLSEYVPHTLGEKFKWTNTEKSTSHLLSSDSDLPGESKVIFNHLREEANDILNAPVEQLGREHIQELWDKAIGAADRFEEVAKQNNISLLKETDQDPLRDLQNIANDESGPKISQQKPANIVTANAVSYVELNVHTGATIQLSPRNVKSLQSIDKVIKDLVAIRKALVDYPIAEEDPLSDQLTDSFNALHEIFEHSSDKKYRRSLRQWNDILLEAGEQGGTSAASHSGVVIAGITDAKGRPLFRNITKEQIDAIKLPMYNKLNHVIHALPGLGSAIVGTWEHLERYEEGWRERRSEDLSPKLQKKA